MLEQQPVPSIAEEKQAPPLTAERGTGLSEGAGEAPTYYPYFDWLRIVLAVGVFCGHGKLTPYLPGETGNFCVQVFFALSGFLIGGNLLKTTRSDLPRFYFNRSTRIWIPYFLAIGLLWLGCVVKGQRVDLKLVEYLVYMGTFVYNFFGTPDAIVPALKARMPLEGTGNHFWSICVEEQFYLLAPLVVVLLPRLRVFVFAALGLLTVFVPHTFSGVSLGVLLAMSLTWWGEWYRRPLAVAGLVVGVCATTALTVYADVSYGVTAPFASVMIVALLAKRGASGPIGRVLGGISYPFYLNHSVGLLLRKQMELKLGVDRVGSFWLGLLVSLGFSLAHYWLVDSQVHRLRGGWYTPARGRWCCAVGFGLFAVGLACAFYFSSYPPS